MTEKSRVREILKKIEDRVSEDEKFVEYLGKLESILDMDLNLGESEQDNARARLPYSSEPPAFEASWN